MKRSSAILLWISLLWFFTGIIFGVYSAAMFYRLLHPGRLLIGSENGTFDIARQTDFAGGTVVHVSWSSLGFLIPAFAWITVWFTDRTALRTRLGRWTTSLGLMYLLLGIAMMIWVISFVNGQPDAR